MKRNLSGTGYTKLLKEHIESLSESEQKELNEFFFFDFPDDEENTKPNAKQQRNLVRAQLQELADVCSRSFGGDWKVQAGVIVPTGKPVFSVNNFKKFAQIAYKDRELIGLFK